MRKQTVTFLRSMSFLCPDHKLIESPYGYPLTLAAFVVSEGNQADYSYGEVKGNRRKVTVSLTPEKWAIMWLKCAKSLGDHIYNSYEDLQPHNDAFGLVWLQDTETEFKVPTHYKLEHESDLDMIKKGYIPYPEPTAYGDLWVECPEIAKLT